MNELHETMMQGLARLAKFIQSSKKEINFTIFPATFKAKDGRTVNDVPFLSAANTPDASQVVYDGMQSYDAWAPDGKSIRATGMSVNAAADLVVSEYFDSKTARIKALNPNINTKEIIERLNAGYQKK
jgi:hypothetical protein